MINNFSEIHTMEAKDCEAAATQNNNVVTNQEEHNLPPRSKKSSNKSSELSAGYDPSRIPSTIFSDKASTPNEWSTASTESLFSINAASYSFSVIKSGELNMINKAVAGPADTKPASSEETISSPPVPLVVSPRDMEKNTVEESTTSEDVAHTTDKVAKNTNDELSSCISGNSNDSHNSTKSFAFPVLASQKEHGGSSKVGSVKDKQQEKLQSEAEPQTTEEDPNQALSSWYSCCKFW